MRRAFAILGLALCLTAPHAWAQGAAPQPFQPFRGGAVLQPTQPEEEGDFRSSPLLRIQTWAPPWRRPIRAWPPIRSSSSGF